MANGASPQGRSAPIARIDHWSSPTAGWNAIDSVVNMQPTDAIRLDNFVADVTNVRLRRGSIQQNVVSALSSSPIRSLMAYNGGTTHKLLASGGGSSAIIADVSVPGTVTTVASGLGSDIWQYVNFATPGGSFLIAVNGTNQQYVYNGTTWTLTTNTWGTGVITDNFATIAAFQNRLFFAAPGSLILYYLPVAVYQGQINMLDLGGYFTRGGVISMLGTWTRDDGFGGSDDQLVVVTDQGEIILFSGIDPSLSSGWSMIGRFVMGAPVSGHRALCRLGPDMLLISQDGFQPLARYLAMGQSQALTVASPYSAVAITAISRRIGNAVSQAVKAAKSLFGWEAILYPASNVLLVNVPQPGASFQQYVVNTINGAWSRFLGLNAYCWAVFQDNIYFGSANGAVVQADTGGDDQGQPIAFDLITSYQLLGQSAQQKRATMCRPFITANGLATPAMDVNTDYDIATVTSPIAGQASYSTYWDQFNWDQANWADDASVQNNWYSVDGLGTAFAIRMSGQAKTTSLNLWAFDIAFESGIGFV